MVTLFATQEAIQSTGANKGHESFSSGYLPPPEKYEAPRVPEKERESGRMWEKGHLLARNVPLKEGKISCKAMSK